MSESFHMAPVFTLGDGICGGMISAGGTAFDGPLDETYHVYGAAGAVHSVELQILQGFPVLGEWGPILLRCDVTAVMDWHNLDTGERGTETRFVPASNRSFTREYVYMNTGPGRVHITMRTDHPSIPVTMDVVVP
ncbi:hypothetical protein Rrhod_3780 [Rhodococcus rhodnii LMG 5362]|uniref:Uncharacterized protein n=1 Tax=Rhodococcus rhodnii LMG 5362 TaxID=1273125 RepID=R7WIA7_9NOCA|nr:hypothetical protein Rrhod_3780 [Rhodococcus rhodnii LMG 5362]